MFNYDNLCTNGKPKKKSKVSFLRFHCLYHFKEKVRTQRGTRPNTSSVLTNSYEDRMSRDEDDHTTERQEHKNRRDVIDGKGFETSSLSVNGMM